MINDSNDSEIERMFKNISDYEDELLDLDSDKYTTGAKENKRRKWVASLKK